ncbi:MAG: hypothetical protein EAZ43_08045 [Betaproteobacteria bacterium]|nr:MAG: hypothetical protein EAZ43_08045 [Betaproteobacteria bacterium]
MRIHSQYFLVVLLVAHFASLQWFAAVHRVAHAPHVSEHAAAGAAHSAHAHEHSRDHDHAHDHRSRSAEHPHWLDLAALGHHDSIDCDRYDAYAGSDLLAVAIATTRFATPSSMDLVGVELAVVQARFARATARGPPV